MKPDDRLNLSVEIVNSSKQNNAKLIDNNLRLSRITEEKLNNSMDGISSRGNSVIHHINDNSVMNGPGSDDEKFSKNPKNDG